MIVKNEAAFLEGCLSSLLGHVDEIIVVDTGSGDDSPDIAQQFGCLVLQHEWRDDFSAARNIALDRASGDWVLYIDADERLTCAEGEVLKHSLPGPEMAAARVKFQPRSDMTSYGEMRLFRRDPRIRFRGAMHETMIPGIDFVCREDGLAVSQQYKFTIVHLGYEGDQSHKHERNLPLLEAAIETDPERVYLRYHIGTTLRALGRPRDAIRQLRQGMNLAGRAGVSEQVRVEGSLCAQVLAEIQLQAKAIQAALDTVNAGHALFGDNIALCWQEARCLVVNGNVQSALSLLAPIVLIDADTFFDERIAYEKSLFREDVHGLIAAAQFRSGDYAGACASYRTALGFAPDSIELRAKLALSESRLTPAPG